MIEKIEELDITIEKIDYSIPVTEKILRSGANLNVVDLFNSIHTLQGIKNQINQLLLDGVLIMPTVGDIFTRNEISKNPIETNTALGAYTNHCNLLNLCNCNIPTMTNNMPFGISLFTLGGNEGFIASLSKATTTKKSLVAVCAFHMRGFPLENQMHQHGATFIKETYTAPCYQFVKLYSKISKLVLI